MSGLTTALAMLAATAVLAAFVVVTWFTIRLHWSYQQESNRFHGGLCPGCGYDIRASTNVCPECGRTLYPWAPNQAKPGLGRLRTAVVVLLAGAVVLLIGMVFGRRLR